MKRQSVARRERGVQRPRGDVDSFILEELGPRDGVQAAKRVFMKPEGFGGEKKNGVRKKS